MSVVNCTGAVGYVTPSPAEQTTETRVWYEV